MKLSSSTFLLSVVLICGLASSESDTEYGEGQGDGLGTIIGIDLGTTYSCVGVMHNGRVEIIANDQGNRITPSYVAFDGAERLIGDAAKNQATVNPEGTIFDVKRLIGRKFHDESVQADKKLVPYDVVNVDDRPFVEVDQDGSKVRFAPEEVSAMILQKMKVTAETFLGKTVDRAVVTVPAYFNDAQRHATKNAGIIAGLQVERIINEPTAAAIAYGMDKTEEANILVFDLGGGTFDVTILSIDAGIFQVLSTNGDTHLGGADFDQRIIQHFTDVLHKRSGVSITGNKRALQKLRKEAERVKRALSSSFQARVEIEDLVEGVDLSEVLTRAKFEELNADLFRRTLEPVKLAMEDAMLDIDEIDEIVLVGGSTRIPKVQSLIKEYFDGKEPNSGVNPDEAVAYGAAVQGSILSGEGGDAAKSILLLDATPLSLGTEVDGGIMSVLIKRGTTIPTEKSEEYVTLKDHQTAMTIDVYEGERSMVEDNHLLGLFEMTDLPPLPRGQAKVLVTFAVDANGILEVTAEDRATKNQKKIVITPDDGRLSEADIERMVQEAEENAEKDKQARERIEGRNALESFLYGLQETVADNQSTLIEKGASQEDLKDLVETIDGTMVWLDENQDAPVEDFKSKRDHLSALSNPIMSKLYSSSGGDTRDEFDDEL